MMEGGRRNGLELRRAGHGDVNAIVDMCSASLGWDADDPNEEFFRWKHLENPFGMSPMWIALDAGDVVGARVFLRWRWRRHDGGLVESVRAVDTATHPEFQGRGIFTDLTLMALDELSNEGIGFVFNTPNDQSLPGYLKMGWEVVGSIPLSVRISSISGVRRITSARVPARKWSELATVGERVEDAFEDDRALGELLESQPRCRALETDRSVEFLRWRYRFEALGYRVILAGRSIGEGFAVYRLRRRGAATELTLCDVIVPGDDRRERRRLIRKVASGAGGDYLVRVGRTVLGPGPAVHVPGLGPTLTWRPLTGGDGDHDDGVDLSGIRCWDLNLGDIELF